MHAFYDQGACHPSTGIITNNYGDVDCRNGNVTILAFLELNGADVRFFSTVTFAHAKFIAADLNSTRAAPRVAISSVNWSPSSITANREAGAILSGTAAAPLATFMLDVFAADFARATPLVVKATDYDAAALAVITNSSHIDVTVPPSPHAHPSLAGGCFDASRMRAFNWSHPLVLGPAARVTVAASPDGAYPELVSRLRASSLLEVYIYQITDDMCDLLVELAADPSRTIRVLVSGRIYGGCDCTHARSCYQRLSEAGVTLRVGSTTCFNYAHQKFWVLDGTSVGWSTGNWGSSDFPFTNATLATLAGTPQTFPPFGASGWRRANRDFSVYVDNAPDVVEAFRTVMYSDWVGQSAANWTLSFNVRCGF